MHLQIVLGWLANMSGAPGFVRKCDYKATICDAFGSRHFKQRGAYKRFAAATGKGMLPSPYSNPGWSNEHIRL